MAHQYQVVTAATVNVFNDDPQELLGDVTCVGNESDSLSYSINPGLVGAVNNQHMFSISPQPGTVIPISAYQPQQLLLVGDGLQQQGLCTIAMAPSNAAVSPGGQFVPQTQVQQLVFGAQAQAENGFYVNTVPLAGPSWVYSDSKSQTIVPSSGGSLLQNLLEQPQNSVAPVLDQQNAAGAKQILVMLPSGQQQCVKVKVTNKPASSSQIAGKVLPTLNHNVEQMLAKQLTQEPADVKPVLQDQLVPVIKDEPSTEGVKNGVKSPSPPSDIIVLKELKPPSADYVKRDPLEQSEHETPPTTQADRKTYMLASQIYSSFKPLQSNLSEDGSNIVEEDKFPESQDVPKYLEVMAVCTHCGYTSMDFNRCQRCRRKLPPRVKTVPVSKNTMEMRQLKMSTSTPEGTTVKSYCGNQPLDDVWNRSSVKKASRVLKPDQSQSPSTSRLKAAVMKKAALEQLDAMAICSYCGYTSKDIQLCERCKRILPENAKFVLTPKINPQ